MATEATDEGESSSEESSSSEFTGSEDESEGSQTEVLWTEGQCKFRQDYFHLRSTTIPTVNFIIDLPRTSPISARPQPTVTVLRKKSLFLKKSKSNLSFSRHSDCTSLPRSKTLYPSVPSLKMVAEQRKVYLRQIANLGDVFWCKRMLLAACSTAQDIHEQIHVPKLFLWHDWVTFYPPRCVCNSCFHPDSQKLAQVREQYYQKALSYVGRECHQHPIIPFNWPHPLVRWASFLHLHLSFRQCGYVVDRLSHPSIVIQFL